MPPLSQQIIALFILAVPIASVAWTVCPHTTQGPTAAAAGPWVVRARSVNTMRCTRPVRDPAASPAAVRDCMRRPEAFCQSWERRTEGRATRSAKGSTKRLRPSLQPSQSQPPACASSTVYPARLR